MELRKITIMVIIDSVKNHQWMLTLVGDKEQDIYVALKWSPISFLFPKGKE